jgi:predicted metal-dependent enzyme (double-stranded beta helix superfamily)
MVEFDIDEFVARCVDANDGSSGDVLAVKDVLESTVATPSAIESALGAPGSGSLVDAWHVSETLTILHIIWPPTVDLFPHDHRMWATIGLYAGREDNRFFRRLDDDRLAVSGGTTLVGGDVAALGPETVHAVANPSRDWTGAIHVYGGDYFSVPRTQWLGDPPLAEPFDVLELTRVVEGAAADARGQSAPGQSM